MSFLKGLFGKKEQTALPAPVNVPVVPQTVKPAVVALKAAPRRKAAKPTNQSGVKPERTTIQRKETKMAKDTKAKRSMKGLVKGGTYECKLSVTDEKKFKAEEADKAMAEYVKRAGKRLANVGYDTMAYTVVLGKGKDAKVLFNKKANLVKPA